MIWIVLLSCILVVVLWKILWANCSNQFTAGRFYYANKWLVRIYLWLRKKHEIGRGIQPSANQKWRYKDDMKYAAMIEPYLCHPLEDDPHAIDAIYFNGFDKEGTSLALRLARKQDREGELWLWLNVPGVGFFQHPIMPDAGVYNMGETGYNALGVRCQVIEPLMSWRVTYNGHLRRGLCNDVIDKPDEYVNVKLSLKWESINDPFNFDVHADNDLLADAIAKETWTREFLLSLRRARLTQYQQTGELSGTITVEGHEPRKVYLKSFRDHTVGVRNWEQYQSYAIHFIWIEEIGVMAMVAVLCMPGYLSQLKTGYLAFANGQTFPVTAIDIDIDHIIDGAIPPEKYSFTFIAAEDEYKVDLVATVTAEAYHYRGRTSRVLERLCTYTVNGRTASGLTEYHYRNSDGPPIIGNPPDTVPLFQEPRHTEEYKEQLTLTFQQEVCRSSLLVGGKGSQLAMLTSIQEQIDCHVPRGFCLTLAAFEQQLLLNREFELALSTLLTAIRNKELSDLPRLCSSAVQLLANCEICQPIESRLLSQLRTVFGVSYKHIPLAVRSSAAGEDGSEASSAGQMETFLGVRGLQNVLEAVKKCWASAYTYQAVEYRRQHGQPVRTSMGVVIQEMVPSDVSGVLFTNDPVTGSPNRIVIDASFGLGEAIVSGKVSPDTIIVQRHFDNSLNILSKTIGEKGLAVRMSDSGGVQETVPGADLGLSKLCCLDDNHTLRLCRLAVRIEEHFGSPRDIEWAIHQDELYLLQARPITTTEQETDDEIIHEFDTPIPTEQELITLGNVGEAMPGAMTALTWSICARSVERAISNMIKALGGSKPLNYAIKPIVSYCGRLLLNLTYIVSVSRGPAQIKTHVELSVMGESLEEHKMDMIESYGKRNKSAIPILKFLYVSNKKIKIGDGWVEKVKTYTVGIGCHTAAELYKAIDNQLPDFEECWQTSVHKSTRSTHYGSLLLSILSGGKEWTIDTYSDVALLLAQCNNVYSADVPAALKKIAKAITAFGKEKTFLEQSTTESAHFLSSEACPSEIQTLFLDFMQRHGHRCIKEGEFIEKSWRTEPEKIIKVIKALVKSKAYDETHIHVVSIEDSVAQIKSPLSWFKKLLLRKWIVKKARAAVGEREFGKSIAVELTDKFKQAYWRLADLLLQEGRLPEKELMFHLTHNEIGQLIKTRSARLVAKAVRRQKLKHVQEEMEFPRICFGRPVPISRMEQDETRTTTFTLQGVPVSLGQAKGTARVVKCLDDAALIQRDDILVVSFTDIGWTPYFPLISGLVTEMGGMVSHGAVVAREYGIPCVVNVTKATQYFVSGDRVHLDGNSGRVHRIQEGVVGDQSVDNASV